MNERVEVEIERLFQGVRPRCNPIKFATVVLLSALSGVAIVGAFYSADAQPPAECVALE